MTRVMVLCASVLVAVMASVVRGAEGDFISNARQLTFSGKTGEGYFSPDGKALIFQSVREEGNPFYQIYILNLENGETHRVSPGIGKTTCAFFRPGTNQVLFASTHLDPASKANQKAELEFLASGKTRRYSWDYDPSMDIFTANRDGSGIKRLTDAPGYDAEGAYSPDGTKIVFSSLRAAYPLERLSPAGKKRFETDPAYFAEIFIMNADGSDQKRLTRTPGYDGGPFFTPDGQRIIWRRFDTNGVIADVFSMNLEGGDVRQITRFGSMSWAPYPHPSGKYLIFTSNKHGFENFELFLVDTAGTHEPVRVTFTDGFDGLPVFSPDGKQLCWTSNRTPNKQSQLFLAKWNHEAALTALGLAAGRSSKNSGPAAPLRMGELSSEIKAADAHAHVAFLASDELEGRKTGTAGAEKAAQYISEQLKGAGVQPFGGNGSYLRPFEFTTGVDVKKEETKLEVLSPEKMTAVVDKDFRPFAFSSSGSFEGEVVFAGYGIQMPGPLGEGYNSYEGLDVSNKIVLVLRYAPEDVEPKRRAELNHYATFRAKAMAARQHGAKAMLLVAGPNSPNAGELVPLTSDGSIAGSEILAASITEEVASALVQPRSLKELQSALDKENPHAEKNASLAGARAKIAIELELRRETDQNVLGLIPGGDGAGYILLGAHYDHLGRGDSHSSRETKEEEGQVHNGADDNASGVAAVLEIAAALAGQKKQGAEFNHGVIVGFWAGEEMGLIGSSKFAQDPPVELTNIIAYLNFDMVGRLRENKLMLQGAGSSSIWRKLIEKRNVAAGFNLVVQDDPYLPTDTTAFYPKGIPVLQFFTGSHDDYHRPGDDTEKVNFEGIERIANLAFAMTQDLEKSTTRPDYLKVEGSSSAMGGRDSLRAYLGTIPDYAAEAQGVKLSGTRAGSPAEKAGIQPGDVIIELAGMKIANIYEYTDALESAKIGQPVKIKVLRDGKEVELTITPEARK